MTDNKKKTFTENRDAKTGEFLSKRQAAQLPPSRVVKEQIPKPGRGDTGRGKKGK